MTSDTMANATAAPLPELSEDRIDEMESAVFARIDSSRKAGRSRHRRGWIAGAAAAAALVLAVAIAPVVGGLVTAGGSAGSDSSAVAPAPEVATEARDGGAGLDQAAGADAIAPVETGREIIASGTATLRVPDVAEALSAVAAAAEARGGYVESSTVGGGYGSPLPIDQAVAPAPVDGGYITVRVPAADLQTLIGDLDRIGDVEASGISRQDVTSQAVDLRARISAAQASVTRLTDLLAQSASVADLIAAETALAERQATLESYQQQLASLDEQVDLSTLTVTLVPRSVPVQADPAGFGDGLAAGFNGLVASVNAVVVAIGFLLPWIAVVAVAAVIVWAAVRLVRRIRRRRVSPAAADRAE